MAVTRTPEQIRNELDAERTELAEAVVQLRGELGAAANVTGRLKAKLPVAAGAAASVGFVLAGGVGATMRYFARPRPARATRSSASAAGPFATAIEHRRHAPEALTQ